MIDMIAGIRAHADLIHIGAELASIVGGFSVLFLALSLFAVRYQNMQSFIYLHTYLSQDQFSTARQKIRTELCKKPYDAWNDQDIANANRVCASYDQAGIFVTRGILNHHYQKIFLRSSWGESVRDQYEALKPYLDNSRSPTDRSGMEFFKHFAELYKRCCKYHNTCL